MTTSTRELQAIATLQYWRVSFLATPLRPTTDVPLEPAELLEILIQSQTNRLQLGVIAFLLVHPAQAPVVLSTLSRVTREMGQQLKYYYMAAVYLQAYWNQQLSTYDASPLPDYFSHELGLPPTNVLHGRLGLAAVIEALQQQAGEPYNYGASFEALIHVLQSNKDLHETACHH